MIYIAYTCIKFYFKCFKGDFKVLTLQWPLQDILVIRGHMTRHQKLSSEKYGPLQMSSYGGSGDMLHSSELVGIHWNLHIQWKSMCWQLGSWLLCNSSKRKNYNVYIQYKPYKNISSRKPHFIWQPTIDSPFPLRKPERSEERHLLGVAFQMETQYFCIISHPAS